jgi:hypothetical protein
MISCSSSQKVVIFNVGGFYIFLIIVGLCIWKNQNQRIIGFKYLKIWNKRTTHSSYFKTSMNHQVSWKNKQKINGLLGDYLIIFKKLKIMVMQIGYMFSYKFLFINPENHLIFSGGLA